MKKLLFGGAGGGSPVADLGLAVLRVAAGVGLVTHGLGKFPPSDRFLTTVGSLGFPFPAGFAWLATAAELGGGVLLVLGLLTRPAAAAAAFTMLVALLGVHRNDPFGRKELAFLYLFVAAHFALTGAGRFSVDRLLRGGRR